LGLGNIRGASIFGNASAIGRDLRAG
jgi:hypothetical protein